MKILNFLCKIAATNGTTYIKNGPIEILSGMFCLSIKKAHIHFQEAIIFNARFHFFAF